MSRRQKARRQREVAHFAAKRAAAPNAAARAAVAFDQLRARLNRLPEVDREAVWQQTADRLDELADDLAHNYAA